jgi:hypothetical protein
MPATQPTICPFTIIIDSAEGCPFSFGGIRTDASQGGGELIVSTKFGCLGRYPHSTGDYSIEGYVGRVGIERKSLEDAQSTVLGWGERRKRFEQELSNLAKLESAVVVIEASFEDCIQQMVSWGTKTIEQNRKAFVRSVIAFNQDYGVKWHFAGSRRTAEVFTFRWLDRFYRKQVEASKPRKGAA